MCIYLSVSSHIYIYRHAQTCMCNMCFWRFPKSPGGSHTPESSGHPLVEPQRKGGEPPRNPISGGRVFSKKTEMVMLCLNIMFG